MDTKKDKLLPCPMCGCVATLETTNVCDRDMYYIRCSGCDLATDDYNNTNLTIDYWNRRVTQNTQPTETKAETQPANTNLCETSVYMKTIWSEEQRDLVLKAANIIIRNDTQMKKDFDVLLHGPVFDIIDYPDKTSPGDNISEAMKKVDGLKDSFNDIHPVADVPRGPIPGRTPREFWVSAKALDWADLKECYTEVLFVCMSKDRPQAIDGYEYFKFREVLDE